MSQFSGVKTSTSPYTTKARAGLLVATENFTSVPSLGARFR